MEEDELLDLVDANDQVIGTIMRSEYPRLISENLGYIRASDMFILNSQGELWVPKRTPNKEIAPNGLDYSCGGHVGSGETYLESAVREIVEELNLELQPDQLIPIEKLRADDIKYFRQIYLYETDTEPTFNPEDFVSAEWLTPKALLTKIESGVPAKKGFPETIEAIVNAGYITN